MSYKIVKAYSLQKLEEKVSKAIESGYIPTGSLVIRQTREEGVWTAYQAVYKVEK